MTEQRGPAMMKGGGDERPKKIQYGYTNFFSAQLRRTPQRQEVLHRRCGSVFAFQDECAVVRTRQRILISFT
jgi:hypothetical protein